MFRKKTVKVIVGGGMNNTDLPSKKIHQILINKIISIVSLAFRTVRNPV